MEHSLQLPVVQNSCTRCGMSCREIAEGRINGAYFSSQISMGEPGWDGNDFYESLPDCRHLKGHH